MTSPAPNTATTWGEQVVQLYELTENVFSMMECKKALFLAGGDVCAAADWLVQGHWRAAKLISWDNDSLRLKVAQLVQQTQRSESVCREALMNCSGHLEWARRQALGLPMPWRAAKA